MQHRGPGGRSELVKGIGRWKCRLLEPKQSFGQHGFREYVLVQRGKMGGVGFKLRRPMDMQYVELEFVVR